MGIYVLFTVKEKGSFYLILYVESLSIFNFIINKLRYNSSPLLHILGIQLPLSIAMYFYNY